jgi:predicted nucleotidyltransferase component of viral defense system
MGAGTPRASFGCFRRVTRAFQSEVARIALTAGRPYGLVLAGGLALVAHGVVHRPTEDIDLFTDQIDNLRVMTAAVTRALVGAGYEVSEVTRASDLGEIFEGFDLRMTELEINLRDDVTRIQLVHFDREQPPVDMAIGPVLHLDDVAASKVVAMATRAEPRDLIDVAALMSHYSPERLVSMAREREPSLEDEEFAEALRFLDSLPDDVFNEVYGLTSAEIADLRDRLSVWPR